MMKKILSFLLCAGMLLSMAACGGAPAQEDPAKTGSAYAAKEADVAFLDKAYEGRVAYHGEFHDHASTGGTSDGKQSLQIWLAVMESLEMDFATIVDHKQALHMELDAWDDTIFIGGSEPMAMPSGLIAATYNKMHFNMIFTDVNGLINTVKEYDASCPILRGFNAKDYPADYDGPDANKLAGGWHFTYLYGDSTPSKEQMAQLIDIIKKNNGMFVNVHPKSSGYVDSENPLDYWYADYTGLEVFYGYKGYAPAQPATLKNYELWKNLLTMGKKVWATAGSDKHNMPNTDALSTVYSEKKDAKVYFEHFKVGDFVCGPVGIRMAIGDATMGGETAFAGNRVVFSVGDFHKSAYDPTHKYRVELHSDKGIVFSQELTDPTQTAYFAVDAKEDAAFYRVEIRDITTDLMHALGNPIWNVK
ncbi:MAG: hypothetical protein IJB02_02685 [Oscillospiraceae bacterium]|nr:hypothetical protein [Oscillospiraceae bacterium]